MRCLGSDLRPGSDLTSWKRQDLSALRRFQRVPIKLLLAGQPTNQPNIARLLFENLGAYTSSACTSFNGFEPASNFVFKVEVPRLSIVIAVSVERC